MSERKLSVRARGKGDLGAKELDKFLQEVVDEIRERRSE